MSKFLRLQATAHRLISENGAEYTLRNPEAAGSSQDFVEGTVSQVPAGQTVTAVILNPKSEQKFQEQYKDANGVLDLSKVHDILISAQGLDFSIESEFEIQYKVEWWTLKGITPLNPNGSTVVFYKGFIRRT